MTPDTTRRALAALLLALLPLLSGPAALGQGAGTTTDATTGGADTAPPDTTTPDTAPTRPLARIGGATVTPADLETALAGGRGTRPGASAEEIRHEVRDRLVAELWAQQVFGREARQDPALRTTLEDAERQILFQIYAQSQFQASPPTDAEIDAYIAANPAFFADRIEYRLQTFRILPSRAPGGPLDTADLAALIAPLSTPPVTEEITAALSRALAAAEIPFERQNLWTGGEALPDALRARLEEMRAANRAVHISPGPDLTEIIILFDTRPAPVDPAPLRDQIAARLAEERFETHARALAAEIAAPLLAAASDSSTSGDGTPRPAPLSPRLLTAIGALGGALGLLAAAALTWQSKARQLYRLARRDSSDDTLTTLERTGPVTALAFTTTGLGTAATLGALATRPEALLSLSGLSLFLGLGVLGAGLGLLLWRPARQDTSESPPEQAATAPATTAPETALPDAHRNLRQAARRTGLLLALTATLSTVFAVYQLLA